MQYKLKTWKGLLLLWEGLTSAAQPNWNPLLRFQICGCALQLWHAAPSYRNRIHDIPRVTGNRQIDRQSTSWPMQKTRCQWNGRLHLICAPGHSLESDRRGCAWKDCTWQRPAVGCDPVVGYTVSLTAGVRNAQPRGPGVGGGSREVKQQDQSCRLMSVLQESC